MSQYDDEYEDDDYVVNPDDWDLDDKFNSAIQKKNEEKKNQRDCDILVAHHLPNS